MCYSCLRLSAARWNRDVLRGAPPPTGTARRGTTVCCHGSRGGLHAEPPCWAERSSCNTNETGQCAHEDQSVTRRARAAPTKGEQPRGTSDSGSATSSFSSHRVVCLCDFVGPGSWLVSHTSCASSCERCGRSGSCATDGSQRCARGMGGSMGRCGDGLWGASVVSLMLLGSDGGRRKNQPRRRRGFSTWRRRQPSGRPDQGRTCAVSGRCSPAGL